MVLKGDRNGFFYVIDRRNGRLISAKNFQYITWATGVDMSTGRPIENPDMRPRQGYRAKGVCPAAIGAKNWMPMAINPHTGTIFMPTFNLCMDMEFVEQEYKRGAFYLAADFEIGKPGPGGFMGEAIAWDPVKQQLKWNVEGGGGIGGGATTTAGNLVFQVINDGRFRALSADKGEILYEVKIARTGMAAPITYEVEGKQYVAFAGGLGRAANITGPNNAQVDNAPMMFVFALDGKAELPAAAPPTTPAAPAPEQR